MEEAGDALVLSFAVTTQSFWLGGTAPDRWFVRQPLSGESFVKAAS